MIGPVDIDFRQVALLRSVPNRRRGNLIAQGLARFDGETVEIRNDGNELVCILPFELVEKAVPVTGRLRKRYPDADFYVVCGDRLDLWPK